MRIILVGFGVVGQSVARIIEERRSDLVANYALNPRIVAVVDRGGAALDPEGLDLRSVLKAKRLGTVAKEKRRGLVGAESQQIISSVEAEVVVEVTHTNITNGDPGMTNISTALKSGKHVVTANKGPLALAMPALLELAQYNGVLLRFSGTVGGGTPILDFAGKCLSVDRITSLKGVLNGTTNYILNMMETSEISFEGALKDAQSKGYAEADPSLDIDGIDTACKLVILANYAMTKEVTLSDVKIRGIKGMTRETIDAALKKGKKIRLLGSADSTLVVEPEEVDASDPLCVPGRLNAVKFKCAYAGDEIIVGRGAGGTETACAILRDLLEIRNRLG